jgi:hypothetical protein
MTNDTHRFFEIFDRNVYDMLSSHVDVSRGYPDGAGTVKGLPHWDDLFANPETGTSKLYCLDRWRFTADDNALLQPVIDDGAINEIDLDTYLAKLHWEPPVENDLEMDDEMYQEGILY